LKLESAGSQQAESSFLFKKREQLATAPCS
jgi:hypothetical protein